MRKYELIPRNGRKSFYGKCRVIEDDTGVKHLISYTTEVMRQYPDGSFVRVPWQHNYEEWTATTGAHIKAFSNLNKKEYLALPIEH